MLHYLPGCDVQKNHPQAVKKLIAYMQKRGAKIETCCRTKKKLLEPGDIMIQNCTLCDLLIHETHPDNTCLSIYEYVLTDPTFPFVPHTGETLIIQDCLRTRENRQLQDAVRECLHKMGYVIEEMPENHEKTRFDGIFMYGRPMQICLDTAPKAMQSLMDNFMEVLDEEEKIKRMQTWVMQYHGKPVAVYCNGCEKGIRLGGGKPVHLVELLAEGLE